MPARLLICPAVSDHHEEVRTNRLVQKYRRRGRMHFADPGAQYADLFTTMLNVSDRSQRAFAMVGRQLGKQGFRFLVNPGDNRNSLDFAQPATPATCRTLIAEPLRLVNCHDPNRDWASMPLSVRDWGQYNRGITKTRASITCHRSTVKMKTPRYLFYRLSHVICRRSAGACG